MSPSARSSRSSLRPFFVLLWLVVGSVGAAMVPIGRAAAHTDVESIRPADGAVVDDPVGSVVVVFRMPVTPVGAGFEILDATGSVVVPTVATSDQRRHVLTVDPPLAGGDIAVRFSVRAEDGHTIEGGSRFTVTAPLPVVPTASAPAELQTAETAMSQPDMSQMHMAEMDASATAPVPGRSPLPSSVYPTMALAAVGGAVASVRLRSRR